MKKILQLLFIGGFTSLLFPPFLFFPIGFISIPCFYYLITKSIQENSYKEIFFEGFIFGLGLNFCLFFWLKNPFLIEPDTKKLFFLSYFYIIYASIYFGLLTLTLKFFKDKKIRIIIFPIIFVIIEIIRSKLFIEFPWNLFGYTLSNHIDLFKFIKFIGIYGLSYLAILLFLLPVIIYNIINKNNTKLSVFYFIAIIFSFIALSFLSKLVEYGDNKIDNVKKLKFILYQNNTLQSDKWNLEHVNKRFNNIINFIEENSKNNSPTIIMFSETEIPYTVIENDNLLKFIQSKINNNTIIIIGAIRKSKTSKNYYNTLFKISYNEIINFDKKILVPFGEYIPLKKFFPFINRLTIGSEDFTKGEQKRKMRLYDDIYFIPTICYENIFFEKIIDSKNIDSDLIINITNDAWFGKYQGPYQHFYQSMARAIEYNKYLIRISNSGISGIINNEGQVLRYSKLNKKEILKFDLELNINNKNFYFHKKNLVTYTYLIFGFFICSMYQFLFRNVKL